ncbi:hypothetical protein I35_1263 [Burkholderia cenocepacia H111]|nr:hypothetical protein I35_1263 [Burkholderia cenocepacia H111]
MREVGGAVRAPELATQPAAQPRVVVGIEGVDFSMEGQLVSGHGRVPGCTCINHFVNENDYYIQK